MNNPRFFLLAISIMLIGFCYGDKPPITRWIDPLGGKPITPQEYRSKFGFPQRPLKLGIVSKSSNNSTNLVEIVVNASIYSYIQDKISRYGEDLESDGYSVRIDTMSSGSADDLRELFQSLRPDIVGAVLVGNLPVKWYRIEEYEEEDTIIEIFPCDYYLMELDGIWCDYENDGILDEHLLYYNNEAEIFLGRIDPSRLTYGDPVDLLRKYFDKNHSYRTGEMPVWASALSYEYKDWHPWFEYTFEEYEYAEIVRDTLIFSAGDYQGRIRNLPYEMVSIMCHSSPWRHYMDPTLTFNNDLGMLPPNANFYHLFACSGARFVEQNDLGSTYLFCGPRSLTVVGSSKTGSIYMIGALTDFFQYLRVETIGEAMRDILSEYGDWNPYWHYGLVTLGDPTLRLVYTSRGTVAVDTMTCTPDGFLLNTPGNATDVEILSSETEMNIYVLNGGCSWYYNIESFRFNGSAVWNTGYAHTAIAGTGDMVISENADYPFIASEGAPLSIGMLNHWSYWSIERGEGYFSHPYLLGADSINAIVYTHWSPADEEPLCQIYLTFYHSHTWDPADGFDFLISESTNEKLYPYAVLDSSGIYWVFWTEIMPDGPRILASYIIDGEISEPEIVGRGIMSTALVSSDNKLWLFWKSLDSKLWSSSLLSGYWMPATCIFEECKVADIRAIPDETGQPVLIITGIDYENNSEIYTLSRESSSWLSTRLTYSAGPDFHPDGLVLPDGTILLAWINGCSGNLQARWNIFEMNQIKSDIPNRMENSIMIYPSPFNDIVQIKWEPHQESEVRIFDINGKLIDQISGAGKVLWNATQHSSGLYFVNVESLGTVKVFHLK